MNTPISKEKTIDPIKKRATAKTLSVSEMGYQSPKPIVAKVVNPK